MGIRSVLSEMPLVRAEKHEDCPCEAIVCWCNRGAGGRCILLPTARFFRGLSTELFAAPLAAVRVTPLAALVVGANMISWDREWADGGGWFFGGHPMVSPVFVEFARIPRDEDGRYECNDLLQPSITHGPFANKASAESRLAFLRNNHYFR